MSTAPAAVSTPLPVISVNQRFLLLLSFAVGALVANIYYAQPILALLAASLDLRPDAAGLIMTLTQVGYGIGMLLVIPLGDLVENKKLILTMIALTVVAELTLGVSRAVWAYMFASVLAGLGASAVQIIVPYSTHLFDKRERGRVIGTLMSGLMLGIMLSRPLASLMTDLVSLHAVFYVSAALMTLLLAYLSFALPARRPEAAGLRYGQLLWSMRELFVRTPTLRRRAVYQALLFGSFCLFWTTVPLLLVHSEFGFTQKGVAVFALAGLAGAVAAPYAGRMADRGFSRRATVLAMLASCASFAISHFVGGGGRVGLAVLVLAANLVDAGGSAHLVLGQRAIFMIDPKNQSRLNGLYMGTVYTGGAVGSALGAWAYLHGGWGMTTLIGLLFPLTALGMLLTEKWAGYAEAA
jgi:predicted MFS family arabinose efflux permease